MEILKFVVVCLILMTKCFAEENQTTDLEPQLKIQKREKQYLIEDDPCERPEQRRDERQSTPGKTPQIEPKIKANPINARLQPKIIPVPPKQVLKPVVVPKPTNLRIDNTPQRIPTKIPVILKTAKVTPGPAHALRLKMMENRRNSSIPTCEADSNTNKENVLCPTKEDPLNQCKKDNIPFTIEDKVNPKSEDRSGSNLEDEVILNQECEVNKLNKEGLASLDKDREVTSSKDKKDVLNKNEKVSINRDGQVTLPLDKIKEDIVNSKPVISIENKEKPETFSNVTPKPTQFFIDDPSPAIKKQPKSEDNAAKNKEILSNKIKEIPMAKKVNNNPNKDESKQKVQGLNDYIGNDPDTIHISNGTHLISIKKINNHDRRKMQHLLTRDELELQPANEERIMNQRPPKLSPPANKKEENPSSDKEENVILSGLKCSDTKNKDVHNTGGTHPDCKVTKEKDPSDVITITNHDYEEFEERTTVPPPVTIQATYDPGSQESCNYLQNLQNLRNLYCNPYHQNVYDQYRRYYDAAQTNPNNIENQDSNYQFAQNQENNYPFAQNQGSNYPFAQNQGSNSPFAQNQGSNSLFAQNQGSNNPFAQNQGSYSPFAQNQESYYPLVQNPEHAETYYPNDNQLNYNNPYNYVKQPEIDYTYCPELRPELPAELRPENTLDRIWRAWKDVEIKIRKAHTQDEPLDIDIRRDLVDNNSNSYVNNVDVIGNAPIPFASQPIGLNGYYNNQNNGLIYPYVNPTYRYMR